MSPAPQLREQAAIADLAARQAAVEVWDRPLLVEAGAGSGKTAVLVARMVAWMIGPGWQRAVIDLGPMADEVAIARRCVEGVVAMTFTEAAAAEMAERARTALEQLTIGELPLGLPVVPADSRQRARLLLPQCRALQATTIHAFAGRLLREHAFEAGLHPGWCIDAEAGQWRDLVDDAAEKELTSRWADDDRDVRMLAAAGQGPAEVASMVGVLAAAGVPAAWVADQALASFDGVAQAAAAALEGLVQTARGPLARAGRGRGRLELAGALLFRLADLSARLRRAPDEAAALVAGFEANLARRLHEWAEGRFTQAETDALAASAHRVAAQAREGERMLLHLGRCSPESFAAAARVAATVLERAEAEAGRRGIVRFADLVPRAGRLLSRSAEVGSAIRARLRQVLIDEVQDTDVEQLELVSSLAFDGPVGNRPGVFLVGDPKQSIYGWRSADLAAYDELGARVEAAGGHRLRLVANFRSVPPILAAVERYIGPVMVREPGIQPHFEPLLPRRGAGDHSRPAVERWRCDPAARSVAATELEADAVARDLAISIAGGMGPERAAVLLRTTTDLPLYLEALRRHGVPYAVARERNWRRRREVIEAAALMRVLLDPGDHVALAAVLRSPLVGTPDAMLETLWSLGLPQELQRDAAAAEATLDRAAAELGLEAGGWLVALRSLVPQIFDLRQALQDLPSDVWVRRVREDSAIETLEAGRRLGAWRTEGVRRLFEQVRRALAEGQSPLELAAALRRGVTGSEDDGDVSVEPNLVPGAVRVMTVHAAKGLDFDHVYVAQLHKEPAARRQARATMVATDAAGGRHLVLAGWPSPDAWRGEEAARRVAAAEQVRLFYVALTRARERLVLVGRPASQTRPHPLSFADLLATREPVDGGPDDSEIRVVELSPAPATEPAFVPTPASVGVARAQRLAAWERVARAYVAIPSDQDDGAIGAGHGADPEQAREVGRVVHRALEIVDLGVDPASLAGRLTELVAVIARHHDQEVERDAQGVLEAFVAGPLWTRWLELRHRVCARELPFVSPPRTGLAVGAVIGVFDCVAAAESPDEPWLIIDYKTDRLDRAESPVSHAERYRIQGEAYAAALEQALELAVRPRVEWWFLREGVAVELPPPPRTR